MKRFASVAISILLASFTGFSQASYITREGTVSFYSSAPLEDIEAVNNRVQAVIDNSTGEIVVRMRIEDFRFSKSLMQKHFNENYMESHIYPEARFTGSIDGFGSFPGGDIPDEVTVTGEITIHGVTRDTEITGNLKRSGPHYLCHAKFKLRVADYDIKIPRLLIRNIAEEVEVTVEMRLAPIN